MCTMPTALLTRHSKITNKRYFNGSKIMLMKRRNPYLSLGQSRYLLDCHNVSWTVPMRHLWDLELPLWDHVLSHIIATQPQQHHGRSQPLSLLWSHHTGPTPTKLQGKPLYCPYRRSDTSAAVWGCFCNHCMRLCFPLAPPHHESSRVASLELWAANLSMVLAGRIIQER